MRLIMLLENKIQPVTSFTQVKKAVLIQFPQLLLAIVITAHCNSCVDVHCCYNWPPEGAVAIQDEYEQYPASPASDDML